METVISSRKKSLDQATTTPGLSPGHTAMNASGSVCPFFPFRTLGPTFANSMRRWCELQERSEPLRFWKVYLAQHDDRIVGVIGLYERCETPSNRVWLGWFGIVANQRRKGLGLGCSDLPNRKLDIGTSSVCSCTVPVALVEPKVALT